MEKYYHLLKKNFENKESVLTELINLEAIMHLPKGTEHFISDIHGEFNSFDYVLRTGSGSIKEKVAETFSNESSQLIHSLCELIYYPEYTLDSINKTLTSDEKEKWSISNLLNLLIMIKKSSQKYTRSKVRKALSPKFSYIIEELLVEIENLDQKQTYFDAIILKLIEMEQMESLITSMCYSIQRLGVDHLHIVGDIYDRGPKPDAIIERLMHHHSLDIQWGNHDIIWIASIAGSPIAMINAIRICARYGNLEIIEERYGINIRPLVEFAVANYTPLPIFNPHLDGRILPKTTKDQANVVQQACAIMQFKLEEQLISRRPEFTMTHRRMLSNVNFDSLSITLNGKDYPLENFNPITIDSKEPTKLSQAEKEVLSKLDYCFKKSINLKKHLDFLMKKGSMYLSYNGNLLYHGCIPLHSNGDFKALHIEGHSYSGKKLLDFFEKHIRYAYNHPTITDDFSTDLLWYLWAGECSSLFGKMSMTTFERYYISDIKTHEEIKNPYYELRNKEEICERILSDFGLTTAGHIINGHTPVKEKKGESPIKANGNMLVIDGGYAKGYQEKTGIAGYTLLSNSYGIQIVSHSPFLSIEDALNNPEHYLLVKRLVEKESHRKMVKDTTTGKKLKQEIADLSYLFNHFEEL